MEHSFQQPVRREFTFGEQGFNVNDAFGFQHPASATPQETVMRAMREQQI